MRELAVSSIAWTNEEEPAIAQKLIELGIQHVEIAPTKIWSDPTTTSFEEAREYVEWWKERGIRVSAFQSMLFSRPDLKIFEGRALYNESFDYLKKFLDLAGVMDVKRLVFGSPKNRHRGNKSLEEANEIAVKFFGDLGKIASDNNTILCIEPNAPQYGCDFITNANEGAEIVRKINEPGLKLHLDTACMALAGDDLAESIRSTKDIVEHFHISSPMLEQVEQREDVDHVSASRALNEIGYDNLISIEMRPGESGTNVQRIEKAVKFAQATYF